ncbi:hypothetical protein K461DRAFT_272194 [Myriangium duriaei CBS 260.36]|uniref:Rhodopsin domain-containing protein n=1 Tax=Myriangium duriaei CBS 260.36 TaxID=1168546 RepID=A0A9P4IQU5_9PEZI|nr:hypothetical protein K461DRAFT_272194 [Myriangium duriaei CBS 260.36]
MPLNTSPIFVVDVACCVISVVCIGLRLYVRGYLVGKIGLDDWLLLAGVIFFVAGNTSDAVLLGHLSATANKLFGTVNVCIYIIGETLIRLAYASFFLGVIPPELDLKWHRYFIITSVALYTLFQTSSVFLHLFNCGSPANLTDLSSVCLSDRVLEVLFDFSFGLNAVLDWVMALIPLSVILRSTMNKRSKFTVGIILSLGCFAGTLCVVVLIVSRTSRWDYSDNGVPEKAILIETLATMETQVAILCLTLAALRPLFRRYLDVTQNSTGPTALLESQFASTASRGLSMETGEIEMFSQLSPTDKHSVMVFAHTGMMPLNTHGLLK